MTHFLVTGPAGFLGYHVIKRLNEAGTKPRVLLTGDDDASSLRVKSVSKLQIEPCKGDFANPASLKAACKGVDVVLHLYFAIGKRSEKPWSGAPAWRRERTRPTMTECDSIG